MESSAAEGPKQAKIYSVADLPEMFMTEQKDKFGHVAHPKLRFLIQEDLKLLDNNKNEVNIPKGSIAERLHDLLIIHFPDGESKGFPIIGNESVEMSVLEIEQVGLQDEQFPKIAERIGFTREQIMVLAAMLLADFDDVSRNADNHFDPAKREKREHDLAITREINGLFERLFTNGYRINGTSQIGGNQFAVSKNCSSHGGVSLTIKAMDSLDVGFDNTASGRQPTERNKGWNGLRDWEIYLNRQPIDCCRAGEPAKFAEIFNGKKPLEVLLEALKTFQVDDASREYLEKAN
ncbi:MAG: hypothetical protein WC843_05035 [Candidatus Gracilibacteria bacterium]